MASFPSTPTFQSTVGFHFDKQRFRSRKVPVAPSRSIGLAASLKWNAQRECFDAGDDHLWCHDACPCRILSTGGISGSRRTVLTRIVGGIEILKTKRSDRRYLRDVLAGLSPVEVGCVAGKDDHASRRKCLHPVTVERFAQTNVEDTGHDRIDSVLRMPMRHQLCTAWRLDPDHIRAGFGGMADNDRKAHRWWKRRKRLPVDVFRQDRSEHRLVWLMLAGHVTHRFFVSYIIESTTTHTC